MKIDKYTVSKFKLRINYRFYEFKTEMFLKLSGLRAFSTFVIIFLVKFFEFVS